MACGVTAGDEVMVQTLAPMRDEYKNCKAFVNDVAEKNWKENVKK